MAQHPKVKWNQPIMIMIYPFRPEIARPNPGPMYDKLWKCPSRNCIALSGQQIRVASVSHSIPLQSSRTLLYIDATLFGVEVECVKAIRHPRVLGLNWMSKQAHTNGNVVFGECNFKCILIMMMILARGKGWFWRCCLVNFLPVVNGMIYGLWNLVVAVSWLNMCFRSICQCY